MTLSIVAHLLGFSELVEESNDLAFATWFCGGSCLEVDAREEGVSYTLWRQRLCGGRPSYARVCPHYSLSLSVSGIVLFVDCCICSYEAHLNIKEGIHTGVFSGKGFPKENLCLLFMLFTLLYIALTGYIHAL